MEKVAILGAGPAGMACAHTLAQAGRPCLVVEKDDGPGGLCRTINFHGHLFDIGGHRFLSKSEEINQLWQDVMGDEMLHVKRLSRIYYRKRFFHYPLSFFNTFWNLGAFECLFCIASYLRCKTLRPGDDSTFEGWVINRFGKRLYEIFFKTYTEKVWAVYCREISAQWARQRIQGLSLRVAVQKALLGLKGNAPKTLAEEFLYPRTGPGEFYHRLKERILSRGGSFAFHSCVTKIHHERKEVASIEIHDLLRDERRGLPIGHLFSSIPLPILVQILQPRAPEPVLQAAQRLRFRSFLVVNVIMDKEHIFPDQWIYVHSPEVKLGRIQNYKNWSPAMVADPKKTSLGLEYFCTQGDELWRMNDLDLIQMALEELEKLGIVSRRHLIDGFVVRRANVYPIYSLDYQRNLALLREYLEGFSNLTTLGRGGLFRYDNSDHALLTGLCAAKNFLGEGPFDLWSINTDGEYLES